MIDSLSIISGKGGSGKTSLAILLSQLISSCNHKVLLVDCDMSTHGATYFFEGNLKEKEKYYTVSNVLYDTDIEKHGLEILHVASNIGFIPSRTDFSSKDKPIGTISHDKWKQFLNEIEKAGFDIIIFDCQAGYSIETEVVTKYSNKNLAVIEADAISASALRILYAQLAEQLDEGKTYQIFNKITKEEKDVYSKITHGTLFPNLTPILFDWNVRKAFVTNELPEISTSNPVLAMNIYELALVFFPQYKSDFRNFLLEVNQKKFDLLEKKLDVFRTNRRKTRYKRMLEIITPVYTIVGILGLIIMFFMDVFFIANISSHIHILISILGISSILYLILRVKRKSDNSNYEILELKKERDQLEEEIRRHKAK